MSDAKLYPVLSDFAKDANLNAETYQKMYQQSINDPDAFWREQAQAVDWIKPFKTVKDVSFDEHNVSIKWFKEGKLNVSANCLDRHLQERGDKTAILWQGDESGMVKHLSYKELHQEVCKFANVLLDLGVKKGDVVCLYLPMIPEAAISMLACTRIGAIHSVVFAGFSPDALASRIDDCGAKVVITSDEGVRGGKHIALKNNVDEALTHPSVRTVEAVINVNRTGANIAWHEHRDYWYHELMQEAASECAAVPMKAEDPLFILYTSGSTGKPKGILHTTGGYMVWVAITYKYVFDYKEDDVFWCTADVGWITGHSYSLYGPLANGATSLMFEGVPNYPDVNRVAEIVDQHKVSVLYTAPTAIRSLMAEGPQAVENTHRETLRLLGTVGEPINPEAWEWYYHQVGEERCPIVDTWWQTETGGVMMTPLPGATPMKPGSAAWPFFGVQPALVDNTGEFLDGAVAGNLVIVDSWPGQSRSIYGDHIRFVHTYFSTFRGMYCTGDGARRDEDGFYWITGRVDDVLNVSGHRMGTAEIESALVAHQSVAEAAVVGYPHDIKGQGIYVYVTLNSGFEPNDALAKELRDWVRKEIGPVASPDLIQMTRGLPKTRSGKIMRRILRKIAANEHDSLGDTSTLADPSVVDELIAQRLNV